MGWLLSRRRPRDAWRRRIGLRHAQAASGTLATTEFTPVRAYNFKMEKKKLKCQIQWMEGGEDTWEFYTDVSHVRVVSRAYEAYLRGRFRV